MKRESHIAESRELHNRSLEILKRKGRKKVVLYFYELQVKYSIMRRKKKEKKKVRRWGREGERDCRITS